MAHNSRIKDNHNGLNRQRDSASARRLNLGARVLPLLLLVAASAAGQGDPEVIDSVLAGGMLAPSVSAYQMKQYLFGYAPAPPTATLAEQWTAEARRIRAHLLNGEPFHGWPGEHTAAYAQLIDSVGERTLGVEAAQLIEIAKWMRDRTDVSKVRLECRGIRNQAVASVAAAIEPNLLSALVVHEGMPSLGYLLDAPVTYQEAPELFCLDLYKYFDLDRLAAVAAPTSVEIEKDVQPRKK